MTFVIALLMSVLGFADTTTPPPGGLCDLRAAVSCLVSQRWVVDDLKIIGLRPGDSATMRCRQGPIPGTSPQALDSVQVVIYSSDRRSGWLFLLHQKPGTVLSATRNAYRLDRRGRRWIASEGNGGIGTYEAISSYADSLETEKTVVLKLKASSAGCIVEE